LYKKYPFDPKLKHHVFIAIGLALWIFIFLFFTEPLDVNEFGATEKLIYLPGYGIIGASLYLMTLVFQNWIYHKQKQNWFIFSEVVFLLVFILFSIIVLRWFYLHIIMDWHPNAYTFWYHLRAIIFPAVLTVLPIVLIGRFALGKYHEKRLEDQKIEIKGEGNYEGLRIQFNEVISIQSSDNYIEVFYLSGHQLKKTLIRNTLSAIDEEFPELLRAHRSYLINPFHFRQWKTENSKLIICLNHDIEVPVSKTYQKGIKAAIEFATN